MLKLHYHPDSTFSRRVRIAILEKGIEAELIPVDLVGRAQFEPEFLAMNPYGRVPVIEDGGFVLYESTAILEYLETLHPDPPLLPAGARERAAVRQRMKICELEFAGPGVKILRPKRFLPKDRWKLDLMARPQAQIEKHLVILGRELEGKSFIADGRFTLADVCYMPFLQFLDLLEVPVPAPVADWAAGLLDRPSARRTRPER